MKPSILNKLQNLQARHEELELLLQQPDITEDPTKYKHTLQEYAELEPIVQLFAAYHQKQTQSADNLELLTSLTSAIRTNESAEANATNESAEANANSGDNANAEAELIPLLQAENQELAEQLTQIQQELELALLPKDPNDNANIFLEIRAGAGGDEASLFSADLARMYTKYAENNNWQVTVINTSQNEQGGYKEIILQIAGTQVYSNLKFESGTHRVQRVPVTEAQGRIHTSTCTVAVMPEVNLVTDIEINSSDLRIDTYRSSGAGGQHVNKTDSAIRITHLPTGVVVECQEERSQHKNRAKAMSLLKARLLDAERTKQNQDQAQTRKQLVGTGDRCERIRTYNFPQGRITDHRINLTLYNLPEVMEGKLESIIQPLQREQQLELLNNLSDY